MNRSNQSHSSSVGKKTSQQFKRPLKVRPLELTSLEEVNIDGESLDPIDPHYQSELEYDGYQSIEAYDNHAYNLDVQGKEDPEKELNFDEREQQHNMGEEDMVDPQGNKEPDQELG